MPANIAELSYYLQHDSQRLINLQELAAERELNASDGQLAQIEEHFRNFVVSCALKNFYPTHKVTPAPIEVTLKDTRHSLGLLAQTSDSSYYEKLAFSDYPTTADGEITADYSQHVTSAAEITETLEDHSKPTSLIAKILKPGADVPLRSLVLADELSGQSDIKDVLVESYHRALIPEDINTTTLIVNGIRTVVYENKIPGRPTVWATIGDKLEATTQTMLIKTFSDRQPLHHSELRQEAIMAITRHVVELANPQQ